MRTDLEIESKIEEYYDFVDSGGNITEEHAGFLERLEYELGDRTWYSQEDEESKEFESGKKKALMWLENKSYNYKFK
jgi:hypothetical protein